MKCLRCGRCCGYTVVIVAPEYVDVFDPTAEFEEVDKCLMTKWENEICPHFSWDGDTAVCAIHDREWFPHTPCGQYVQEIELSEDTPCRTGAYMREQKINVRDYFNEKG